MRRKSKKERSKHILRSSSSYSFFAAPITPNRFSPAAHIHHDLTIAARLS